MSAGNAGLAERLICASGLNYPALSITPIVLQCCTLAQRAGSLAVPSASTPLRAISAEKASIFAAISSTTRRLASWLAQTMPPEGPSDPCNGLTQLAIADNAEGPPGQLANGIVHQAEALTLLPGAAGDRALILG